MTSVLESLLEEMAKNIILADAHDLPSLGRLHEILQAAQQKWDHPPAAATLSQSIGLIESLIFDSDQDKTAVFKEFTAKVTHLIEMARNVPCPDAANAQESSPIATDAPSPLPTDDEILRSFLGRQDSVLEEMEACILGVEKNRDTARLDALRRIIHTLKGEAGVLGMSHVERVCHAAEDYLQKAGESTSGDMLLQVKDYFAQCFGALSGNGNEPAEPGAIIARLAGAGPAEAPAHCAMQINLTSAGDPALICDFVSEAKEHLHQADIHLLALENNPLEEDSVNGLFRVFHTIKGVAHFLSFEAVGSLAHATENMLDLARKGELVLAGERIDAIFSAVDAMKREMGSLRAAIEQGTPYAVDSHLPDLIERIKKIAFGEPANPKKLGEILIEAGKVNERDLAFALQEQARRSSAKLGEILVEKGAVGAADVSAALQKQQTAQSAGKIKETIKVDTERLDKLLDTVGELVIAEAMVTKDDELASRASARTVKNMQQLSKIARELQELGMSMRMVSIKSTFQKMARLVRDLAKKAGKEINFVTLGEDTELDKTVIENIGDPLVHMVRNSADHGIETPGERVAVGKPRAGTVCLRSYQKSGSVYIEIEDDGKGLDKEAIVAKARVQGLVQADQEIDDQEAYKLIFKPGFSTAKEVTDVSGRGVGMDVVRKNIEALRGSVEIATQKGKGTKFSIRLPLMLAIIDGMVVRVGHERYIVPTLSVVETFRPLPKDLSTALTQGEMILVHGKLVPLFRLSRLFDIENSAANILDGIVMIVDDMGKQIGLLIDAILGQQQTVIKSLSEAVGKVPGVSGGAIMSDGKISLILDVAGIVRMASGEGHRGGGIGEMGVCEPEAIGQNIQY